MDSEMYTDFTVTRKEKSKVLDVEKVDKPKNKTTFQKDVMEALTKIFVKIGEVEEKVVKSIEGLKVNGTVIKEGPIGVKDEAPKVIKEEEVVPKPEPSEIVSIFGGGGIGEMFVTEVEQLLSEIDTLKNAVTNTHDVQVQQGGLLQPIEAEIKILRTELDLLKLETDSLISNLRNIIKYLQYKEQNVPVKMQGGWKDGRLVIHVKKALPSDL